MVLASWLQSRFGLGMWILAVGGILGVLTSISTVRSCLRALRKAAQEASPDREHPASFNDHK